MTNRSARIVLAASLLVLVALVVAWAAWPRTERRADLVAGPTSISAPPTTTTTSAPTTTTPAVTSAPAPPVTPPPAVPGAVDPVGLRIPSLGVDAPVVSVAQRADGQMEIPGVTQVGWYRLGPRPGGTGSAVLAAHIDYGGRRGVFFDLPALAVGAEVQVLGADLSVQRFVVTALEQVGKDQVDLTRYFTAEGPTRLTLITCGGAFDPGVRHYTDNIIVTAVPA